MSLFREIGDDCIPCVKRRKKYLDVEMGPIADEQLLVAPPFWVTMCDIFGPCYIYVPGMEDRSYSYETTEFEEEISHVTLECDPLMSLICAVNTDLTGVGGDLVPGYN